MSPIATPRLEAVRAALADDRRARGRVLDAGTGGGRMTALLAALSPAELVSVSLDESDFGEARRRLPAGAEGRVRFVRGDLAEPGLLAGPPFDLVVGDYLLAAAAGLRPFGETSLLAALVESLAPGGLLVLTGMQPFEPCRSAEQEAIRGLLRWWAALSYLAGEEMYREAPAAWVVARLREVSGGRLAIAEPEFTPPLEWSPAELIVLAGEATLRAEASGDARLASFARSHLPGLVRQASRLPGFRADGSSGGHVAWSRDWIIRAGRSR